MENEKKPLPGDPGYQGGTFTTTAYINGKAYEVTVVKDANGNVIHTSSAPKFLGIF